MNLDLKKIPIRKCEISNSVIYDKDYYEPTGILGISPVNFHLSIFQDANQIDVYHITANGFFILKDARTLEPIHYPFEIDKEEKIEEESEFCGRFLGNSQNTLDILDILWENIVLEIPISYTVSEKLEETKEIGEESNEIDPRLAPLMELLEKEKE